MGQTLKGAVSVQFRTRKREMSKSLKSLPKNPFLKFVTPAIRALHKMSHGTNEIRISKKYLSHGTTHESPYWRGVRNSFLTFNSFYDCVCV